VLPAFALSLVTSATYDVDADESLLFVQVFKDPTTLLAGMSHDHVVRARAVTGTVELDPETGSCRAELRIPVAALEPDEPWLRKQVRLADRLDESDRATVKRNMLARAQLDAKRFPEISVTITQCKVVGGSERVNLTGALEIRGQSSPLDLVAEVTEEDGRLRVRGSFTKRHRDFGFAPYSAGLGTLKNREELTFVFNLVAVRR
jgi:polyisoprenoid-binding protein YceI